ncbi:hypothetical protein ACL1C8_11470 [Corynebacterium striatum]
MTKVSVRTKLTALSLALEIPFAGTGIANAEPTPSADSIQSPLTHGEETPETTVTHLENGEVIFHENGREIRGSFNAETGQSTLTDETGETRVIQVLPPAAKEGEISVRSGGIGGFACTMLLWAVDLVHSGGWTYATKIVSRAGLHGKALALAMWGLGSSGFLAAVSSKC